MTDPNAIDPERAAQITERIGQAFDFIRDTIDNPHILEELPDGAELRFRDVTVQQHIYHVVAYQPDGEPEHWVARTMGRTNVGKLPDRSFWIAISAKSDISAEAAMTIVESALRAAEESDQISHRIA